jgi:hypothetical protein
MNYECVDKNLREAKFFLGKMQVEQQRMGIEHKRERANSHKRNRRKCTGCVYLMKPFASARCSG